MTEVAQRIQERVPEGPFRSCSSMNAIFQTLNAIGRNGQSPQSQSSLALTDQALQPLAPFVIERKILRAFYKLLIEPGVKAYENS